MIMKYYLIFALFLISSVAFSQKLYVWCPKDQMITSRTGFLEDQEIDIVVFDGRLLTKNSKVECSPEETVIRLQEFIRETYPSARVNLLESSSYFKDPVKNRITIKVGVAAFHAAFGADIKVGIGSIGGSFAWGIIPEGKWNALTGYSVSIYDYRENQEQKFTKEIAKVASKSNTGGYITAKNILNRTFMEANQELLFFIDNTFMK